MKIIIETIDHKDHRYPTIGDYWYEEVGLEEILHIRVSRLSDRRREALIIVHELVEALSCREAGISEPVIAAFDIEYEKHRKPGDESEPGDDPSAPYVNQHCLATGIEMILAQQWGVKWAEYGKEIATLP